LHSIVSQIEGIVNNYRFIYCLEKNVITLYSTAILEREARMTSKFGFVRTYNPQVDSLSGPGTVPLRMQAIAPIAAEIDPIVRELLTDLLETEGVPVLINYQSPAVGDSDFKWETLIAGVQLVWHDNAVVGRVWGRIGIESPQPNRHLLALLLAERTGIGFLCIF
jgi:hypothetical protein